VTFADRVEKQNLYQRASFAAELEMPLEDVQRLRNSLEAPMEDGKPMVTNKTPLSKIESPSSGRGDTPADAASRRRACDAPSQSTGRRRERCRDRCSRSPATQPTWWLSWPG